MHKHHNHCEHEVEYCKRCDKPYCTKCGQEWELPCGKVHYPTYYYPFYYTSQPTYTEPYRITWSTGANYEVLQTGGLTCNHTETING